MLNWPDRLGERTPSDQRTRTRKFGVGWDRTQKHLRKLLDGRMDVEMWGLDDDKSSRNDPGVVIRWTLDGQDFAIACDKWTTKRDNLRECYLWLKETQVRGDRPVVHGGSHFAAAALPPGDEGAAGRSPHLPPHEVLGVAPDADPEVVRQAGRVLMAKYKPGEGEEPDPEKFQRVREAKEAMLE